MINVDFAAECLNIIVNGSKILVHLLLHLLHQLLELLGLLGLLNLLLYLLLELLHLLHKSIALSKRRKIGKIS
jgi:hypothetical protein